MAKYKEEVMVHVDKFRKRMEQRQGNLARHTKREEDEIADMQEEIRMLQEYARSLPNRQPELVEETGWASKCINARHVGISTQSFSSRWQTSGSAQGVVCY